MHSMHWLLTLRGYECVCRLRRARRRSLLMRWHRCQVRLGEGAGLWGQAADAQQGGSVGKDGGGRARFEPGWKKVVRAWGEDGGGRAERRARVGGGARVGRGKGEVRARVGRGQGEGGVRAGKVRRGWGGKDTAYNRGERERAARTGSKGGAGRKAAALGLPVGAWTEQRRVRRGGTCFLVS